MVSELTHAEVSAALREAMAEELVSTEENLTRTSASSPPTKQSKKPVIHLLIR